MLPCSAIISKPYAPQEAGKSRAVADQATVLQAWMHQSTDKHV